MLKTNKILKFVLPALFGAVLLLISVAPASAAETTTHILSERQLVAEDTGTGTEGTTETEDETTTEETKNPFGGDKVTMKILMAQLMSIIFIVIAIVVYLIIDLVLVGRWVMLAILGVLSPLPFILMILPATQQYAKMWWDKFIKWTTVGIAITFFLWLYPQVLGAKNVDGYWESKEVAFTFGLAKTTVMYPEFLGGSMSPAQWMDNLIMFFLSVGFLIAAAWAAITMGETFGKLILKAGKSAGKTARKLGKLGAKQAWEGSGAGDAARQKWGEMTGPGKALRTAVLKDKIPGGKKGNVQALNAGKLGEAGKKFGAFDKNRRGAMDILGKGEHNGEKLTAHERGALMAKHGVAADGSEIKDYDNQQGTGYLDAQKYLTALDAGEAPGLTLANNVPYSALQTADFAHASYGDGVQTVHDRMADGGYDSDKLSRDKNMAKQPAMVGALAQADPKAFKAMMKKAPKDVKDMYEDSHAQYLKSDGIMPGTTLRPGQSPSLLLQNSRKIHADAFGDSEAAYTDKAGIMQPELVTYLKGVTDLGDLNRLKISDDDVVSKSAAVAMSSNQLEALSPDSAKSVRKGAKALLEEKYATDSRTVDSSVIARRTGMNVTMIEAMKTDPGKFGVESIFLPSSPTPLIN